MYFIVLILCLLDILIASLTSTAWNTAIELISLA